jgi:DNA-binding Lrp family transcriptional regulator
MESAQEPDATTRILELLLTTSLSDGLNKYKIAKETGLSYSRVHTIIENLEAQKIVKSVEVGHAPAGPKKNYAPAFSGLVVIMHKIPEFWGMIDEISLKQAELLPLVFGKWDCLAKPEIKKRMISNLKKTFEIVYHDLAGTIVPFDQEEPKRAAMSEEEHRLLIARNVIWPDDLTEASGNEQSAWARAVTSDPELKRFVTELRKDRFMIYEARASNYKRPLKAMEHVPEARRARLQRIYDDGEKRMKSLMIKLERDTVERLARLKVLKNNK